MHILVLVKYLICENKCKIPRPGFWCEDLSRMNICCPTVPRYWRVSYRGERKMTLYYIHYNGKTLKFNSINFVNLHHWKNNKQEKPNGFSEISSSSPSVGQTSNICGRPELLKILFQENLFLLKLILFFQTYSLPMIS